MATPSPLEAALRVVGPRAVHDALTPGERELLRYSWVANARPLREIEGIWHGQLPPPGAWATWLYIAGRRSGKTWTGAHWSQAKAEANAEAQIALVGRTIGDARKVMVFGKTGIMRLSPPWFRPRWYQTDQALIWPNGAMGFLYSSEEPEKLRGPEHSDAWGDELCAWAYPETFDMLQMTMSGGANPQTLLTTTPKRSPILKDLMAESTTVVTRGSTYDNASNLPKNYLKKLLRRYEGTTLGRQELLAEVFDEVPGALWTQTLIDSFRVKEDPARPCYPLGVTIRSTVVALDPITSQNGRSDLAGIVVVGLGEDDHLYVLADLTFRASPLSWATRAIGAFHKFKADRLVYEKNKGGPLVEAVLRGIEPNLPLEAVQAREGKFARAEPLVSLYEQGLVHHVGGSARPERAGDRTLVYLENQMCTWSPEAPRAPMDGEGGHEYSPDRMDALVYAGAYLKPSEPVGCLLL